jgi:hypothetical protein
VGARTDAARAEVLVAREALGGELERLEASGRAAVDIPSKVRRAPAKTAGIAAGAAFLVAGGPKRVFRRAKRAVIGPEEPLPKSMLPDEVEKTLRKMGSDGARIRGTLEREFTHYLEEHRDERERRDITAIFTALLASAGNPLTVRAARRLAQQLFTTDASAFETAVQRVRERRAAGKGTPGPGH